jgi:2TM domain
LIGINLGTTPDQPWAVFPLLGWGFGLMMHALAALGPLGRIHQALVERELARLSAAREGQR